MINKKEIRVEDENAKPNPLFARAKKRKDTWSVGFEPLVEDSLYFPAKRVHATVWGSRSAARYFATRITSMKFSSLNMP